MTKERESVPSLPEGAKAVIWRIFSEVASPRKRLSPHDAVEAVVRHHLPPKNAARAIAEILGWFETHEERHWLDPDIREAVATMILDGLNAVSNEAQVWAIGSIDAEISTSDIPARWSSSQIDTFWDHAVTALEKLVDRKCLFDLSRLHRPISPDAELTRQAVVREGRLETYQYLDNHGFDLVINALHPTVGNLIDLLVALRPESFASLVERLDHPVMQARAAHHMVAATLHSDHRAPLNWIVQDSCDGLIALAILHTLHTVNRLDNDIRLADDTDPDGCRSSTELRPGLDDLDSAADALLGDLVDRLAMLDPIACARWIGELLSSATYELNRQRPNEMPQRVARLEKACTDLCARLVRQDGPDRLLAELIAGLRHTHGMGWPRHVGKVAWELRDTEPAWAAETARVALNAHETQIAAEIERGHAFLVWQDWDYVEWLKCLGAALALSDDSIDLPQWVETRCQSLPLSVWDVEEDHSAFLCADRVAQHRFLIALNAIPALGMLGRPADPGSVRALAESLWAHTAFADKHIHRHAGLPSGVEYAARQAIECGSATDAWILEHARNPDMQPHALWALMDQRQKKICREAASNVTDDDFILPELARIASDRFHEGAEHDLETLRYWALLWLLLGSVDEAEATATAMLAFPLKAHDRTYKILALRLLVQVAQTKPLPATLAEFPTSLYRQLWSSHTPSEELSDRQEIDDAVTRSASFTL